MPSTDFPAHHLGCFTIYHEQILAEVLKTATASAQSPFVTLLSRHAQFGR